MVSLAYATHIVHDICLPHPDPHTSGILDQFSLPELQLPKIPGSWDSPHLRNRQNEGEHSMNCHDQGWFPPERVKDYPGAKLKIREDRENRQEDFLMIQWFRIHLPVKKTQVRSPLWEDSPASRQPSPRVSSRACELQLLKLAQNLCSARHKAIAMRSVHTATKE